MVRAAIARASGIRRVEAYYTEAHVIDAYRRLYGEAASWRA